MKTTDKIKRDIETAKKDIKIAKHLGDESWLYERTLKELQDELAEWEA